MRTERTSASRTSDVLRLLRTARGIVERRGALTPALVASTGLSVAGVELALTKHLELDATNAELASLVRHAGDAKTVAVILSSNVFVGALRAIAIARAASEDVLVRPSRRDPAFARALVDAADDPAIRLDERFDVPSLPEGEIHVYGHDSTIADVRARALPGVRVVGHGSGMGIAWISGRADLASAAGDLAHDVVAFDQRGCLSPRIALVEGPQNRTDRFGELLHLALDDLARLVPRGVLPAEERAESERYIATMTYASRVLVGRDHVVGVAPSGAPLVASPSYRHVHVVAVPDEPSGSAFLAPIASALVAVGSDDLAAARRIAPRWARIGALGFMQRPRLDGPVDLRPA